MKKLLSFTLASMLVCFTAMGIPYIFNFGGNGTNTSNYGVFMNLGTNNAAAVVYIYDADGTTILGGFDTNRGGWFGLGLSNQVTMDITNVTIYNTLTIQSNVIVNLTTNVVFNVKGGSKIVFQVPSSLVNSNATPSTIAYWDALNTLTNLPNGTGFPNNNGSGGFTWYDPALLATLAGQNNLTGSNYLSLPSGYVSLQSSTNAWSGPTNTVDMNIEDQYYSSPTACQITGIINKGVWQKQNVILTLYNSSATNWNLTVPSTMCTVDGTKSITCTNGQERLLWLRYHPGTGRTNLVQCPNF